MLHDPSPLLCVILDGSCTSLRHKIPPLSISCQASLYIFYHYYHHVQSLEEGFKCFEISFLQMEGSDQKFVTLRQLDLRSTGVYRCEVSAEGPSFASVSKSSILHSDDLSHTEF